MQKRTNETVDIDKIKGFLENTLTKLKKETDIETLETLTKIKRVYKKTVPFWLRNYVASYLINEILGVTGNKGGRGYANFSQNNKRGSFNKIQPTPSPATHNGDNITKTIITTQKKSPRFNDTHKKFILDPNMTRNIFINVGKMRHVFSSDIVSLLTDVAGLDKDRIGDIKVFGKCTYVELLTDDGEVAIEKLSGYEFKHIKLSVCWSKNPDRSYHKPSFAKEIVIKLGDKNTAETNKTNATTLVANDVKVVTTSQEKNNDAITSTNTQNQSMTAGSDNNNIVKK